MARYQAEWQALDVWLDRQSRTGKRMRNEALPDQLLPQRYRRACQQLALAQQRGYSLLLIEQLQQRVQRVHRLLYRPAPTRWYKGIDFLLNGFPRLVRQLWPFMLASLLCFVIPLLGSLLLIWLEPHQAYGLLDRSELAGYEEMYSPDAHQAGMRTSLDDLGMFAHYIYNNISIGFRTFASGMFAGIGSLIVLITNGIMIGGVAGHLQASGLGPQFWPFVAGHGAFELTAIVIAGGAGLQLGISLLAPGSLRRRDALVYAGQRGGLLCIGILFMLTVAALLEAFWSSSAVIPDAVKYGVAALLWLVVAVWLLRGGRQHAD